MNKAIIIGLILLMIVLVGCKETRTPCWRKFDFGDSEILIAGYMDNVTFTQSNLNLTETIEGCCTDTATTGNGIICAKFN